MFNVSCELSQPMGKTEFSSVFRSGAKVTSLLKFGVLTSCLMSAVSA